MSDAVETFAGHGPILLTCEHASERVPPSWEWPDQDAWLRGTHWSHDLGARELTLELAAALDAAAVLSRFSRLIIDPNRPEDSPTLFRTEAEGREVHLNTRGLDAAERRRRLDRLLRPYHAALDEVVAASSAPTLVAMHTFTDLYEGQRRSLEVGVLFDLDGELAKNVMYDLADAYKETKKYDTAMELLEEIMVIDITFRDVSAKVEGIRQLMDGAG